MKQNRTRLCAFFGEFILAAALLLWLAPEARAEEALQEQSTAPSVCQEVEPAQTMPTVNQDVCAIESDSGTFAVGQAHTWILRGGVPDDLGSARSYVLTDQLDAGLSLEPGSGLVILHTRDGRQRPLKAREHYELEEGRGKLRLALTPAGMAYVAEHLGEGTYIPEIRLSFRVVINRSAAMGSALSGQARLSYTDGSGATYDTDADRPEVHTGGLHIALTDGLSQPLSGGRFRLARLAGEEGTEMLCIDGKEQKAVFVPFYVSADLKGEMVTEMTTNRSGLALAYGLPYGVYYLVQTQAPGGHDPIQPIPVTVNEASHLTAAEGWTDSEGKTADHTVSVINGRKSQSDALFYLLFPKNRL